MPISGPRSWIGVATQRGTAGMFDGNLTIDPLRPVHDIPAEGEDGFLARLDSNQRARFDEECRLGSVGSIDEHIWGPIAGQLRERNSYLTRLLDYLQAIAVPLYRQLARLETVEQLSTAPARPDDWRLSPSACFLKLAYWPDNGGRATDLADGMYLPVSYVRLLLDDPCTLSGRTRKDGTAGRVLGYPQVPRRLTNTQFIDLVKHGFAGTIGVTVEQLRELVDDRIRAGASIVLAYESSSESSHERSRRIHSRVPRKVVHRASPRRPAPSPTPRRGTGHR